MKVTYREIKIIAHLLGYDGINHPLRNITSISFLEQEGLTLTRIGPQEWDMEFESPQAELLFVIKHSEHL